MTRSLTCTVIQLISISLVLLSGRGMAEGKQHIAAHVLNAPKEAGSPAAARELLSGEMAFCTFPPISSPTLFTGDNSRVINVPEGATRLEVLLTSLNAEVDLYVRHGQDVTLAGGQIVADFRSEADGGDESIVITGPSLRPGPYYIAIAVFTPNVSAACKLSAIYTGALPTNTLSGAHFAAGGGWFTSLFLTNGSSNTESYTVRVYGDNGAAVPDAFRPGTGEAITGRLGPGATQIIDSTEANSLRSGWLAVIPGTVNTRRISGFAVFRSHQTGRADFEATVPLTSAYGRRNVLLFDNMNRFGTGVALMNPSEFNSITVNVNVRDENGLPGATYTLNLRPLGHTAVMVPDAFPATADKRGSLLLTSSQGTFGVLGLRFSPEGPFTSFPPQVME